MKETKISSSNLDQVKASMQSYSYEPTSGDAPAKGSKDNPYTWSEYCTMTDSTEPLSSSFFFLDDNGKICFSLAEIVITYSGSSCYEGSSYSGYSGGSDYQGTSGVYNLSNPDSGLELLSVLYEKFKGGIGSFAESVSEFFNGTESFPVAVLNYHSGSPIDLTFDVNNLGLKCLSEYIISHYSEGGKPDIGQTTTINLLNPDILEEVICHAHSAHDIACYGSTALVLGNITLLRTKANEYTIVNDTYNFEWKKGKKFLGRNIVTVLGKIVNEGICMTVDNLMFGPLGLVSGFINRNVTGTTVFDIHFTGTLKIN